MTGIGLAGVIHTQTSTLLYISVLIFIETVSPSEIEVAALPNNSVNAGREGKTLSIVSAQIMFILL